VREIRKTAAFLGLGELEKMYYISSSSRASFGRFGQSWNLQEKIGGNRVKTSRRRVNAPTATTILREPGRPKRGENVEASKIGSLRLPISLWKRAKKRAKQEQSTVNAVLRGILAEHL
jgi:hypothetical protein